MGFSLSMTVALDPGLRLALAAKIGGSLREMPDGNRLDPGKRGLGARPRCAEDPWQPSAPRSLGQRDHASHGPEAPVEPELADGRVVVEPLARDLARGGEDGQGDREVEARALLPKLRGREIDRDSPTNGPFELGGGDSAPDAVLRLLAGAVGKPDDGEAGDAVVEVSLDLDAAGIETDERMRDGAREHLTRLGSPPIHVCAANVPKTNSSDRCRSLRPRG